MYKGYKIIPFIPAGRKKTMSILVNHLLRFKNNPVDQVYVWVNTKDEADLDYIYSLEKNHKDYFKLFFLKKSDWHEPKQLNTGKFYIHTIDPQAIYVRFDDDIVYIDDNYFKNILDFRINNPKYFLVCGNIINNAVSSYVLQRLGLLPYDKGVVGEEWCMDDVGWKSPEFADFLHGFFIKKVKENKVSDLYYDRWILLNQRRFSISNFCFFGRDFAKFKGIVKYSEDDEGVRQMRYHFLDEENWLVDYYPRAYKVNNVICGSAIVVHFTFFFQREHIFNNTNYLREYQEISKQRLSDAYYNLLE